MIINVKIPILKCEKDEKDSISDIILAANSYSLYLNLFYVM